MPNFTTEQLRSIMDITENIRCLSVIAHVDHGKSTLTDSLVSKAGIIAASKAGEARFTDTRADEQARSITIKSTGISMYFEYDLPTERTLDAPDASVKAVAAAAEAEAKASAADATDDTAAGAGAGGAEAAAEAEDVEINEHSFLINLIDSPGHVDFSSEVTAALRVTDGALVVVDCIEGVSVQTETVLRQALSERIRPVLILNKMDRILLELKMDPEEAYQSFNKSIETVNVQIATYQDKTLPDQQVSVEDCSVAFGSGLQAWGFTLKSFAKDLAVKFKCSRHKMRHRMWGDQYFVQRKDPKTGKKSASWKKTSTPPMDDKGRPVRRTYVKFCLEPIYKLAEKVMSSSKGVDDTALMTWVQDKCGVTLKSSDRIENGQPIREKILLKRIMQKWIPAGDTILEMIVTHLPSPRKAQAYRTEQLYEGPLEDEAGIAMKNCDVNGPLMMYVSKMVPTGEAGRFYAFGRVFSGCIEAGKKYRIMGPNYVPGKKDDLWIKPIQRVLIMMGRFVEQVNDIPAGNTCALVGVDQYLIKSGTISSFEGAHNIKQMKYSVSPVVRVAVSVKNASDLPKLVEGLKRLSKSDPLVVIERDQETGENVIAGAGELHLEICLKDLQEDFMGGATLNISDPVVSYRETITKAIDEKDRLMSKSENKHNRLYVKVNPMSRELMEDIEKGTEISNMPRDWKAQATYMGTTYPDEVDKNECDQKRLWGFGPEGRGPNLFIDGSSGVQYLNEIRDHVNSGFQEATIKGPLAQERVVGCIFRLIDATLHSDSIHRGVGQIAPTARRVVHGCICNAGPTLKEPFYIADILVPQDVSGAVYSLVSTKRGQVFEEEQREGTPLMQMKAHLPVAESFGFTTELRAATGGKAFPQLIFSHYEDMSGNVYDNAKLADICVGIRERKGIKAEIPAQDYYIDRE